MVFINFFSIPSFSLLLPIFFLILCLHTPMTSLCSPGQYSYDHYLPNGFWGHRKSEQMCRSRRKNWRQVWFGGKKKMSEEEDPDCAGLTINWSLWKLSWKNLTENYQEMPGTFQTPSSLSPTGTTCQCLWHSHKSTVFLSLFKSNLQQPLSTWLPRKMRTIQSFCLFLDPVMFQLDGHFLGKWFKAIMFPHVSWKCLDRRWKPLP